MHARFCKIAKGTRSMSITRLELERKLNEAVMSAASVPSMVSFDSWFQKAS